ncbi:hypothetical protein LB504_002206 [Fusarium proliferatum]|nr:hypothetical protein LB504_002206 [Fusarium proliferatum]
MIRIFLGTFAVLDMQAKEKPSPTFPIDLGVSLIFTRPNETYRPVYPFPIVFDLTGAAKAWPYGFELQWCLEGNWKTRIQKEDVPIVYGSAPDWLYSPGSLDPATEPYFVINATGIMSNTSPKERELGWSLSILQECSPGLSDIENIGPPTSGHHLLACSPVTSQGALCPQDPTHSVLGQQDNTKRGSMG